MWSRGVGKTRNEMKNETAPAADSTVLHCSSIAHSRFTMCFLLVTTVARVHHTTILFYVSFILHIA